MRRVVFVAVAFLIAAPAVAAIVALAGRPWSPTFDLAIIDLRVRDVFTTRSSLTGLYSRPGWNHPGPLLFWGIAPLSWLSGHAPWATRVGGAILELIALVWLTIATGRWRLRLLLAAGIVTSSTYLASNQWLFREPWNLHIPVPYFLVFLFVTFLTAMGRFGQLIAMSIAGTVLVQTHVGYAPLVAGGFVYAAVWILADVRRDGHMPDRWRSTVVIAGAVWGVTWTAPIAEVIDHWPGNLGAIGRYFVDGERPTVGFGRALQFMAAEFRLVPPWLAGENRLVPFSAFAVPAPVAWLFVPLLLAGIAALALKRSRSQDGIRMLGLGLTLLVVGTVAISSADQPLAYTFQWRVPVSVFFVVACLWSIGTVFPDRHRLRVTAIVVAMGVVAWGSVAMTEAVMRHPNGLSTDREPDLARMMRTVDRSPPHGTLRLRWVAPSSPGLFDGVVNELDRRGIDVRVDPKLGRIFGPSRVLSLVHAAPTWYVTEVGSQISQLLAMPGAHLVAATTPLRPGADHELGALQARIGAQLDRNGTPDLRAALDSGLAGIRLAHLPGIDFRDLRRLAELNANVERSGRCRCAMVAVPSA